MGAWGVGIFEDDTNLDWIEDEFTAGGVEAVRSALHSAAQTPAADYLDFDEGTPARVAAEIVAVSFDAGHPDLEADHREMLMEHAEDVTQDRDLISLALRAVIRINAENSELKELWTEGNEASWTTEIEGLESRLRGLE